MLDRFSTAFLNTYKFGAQRTAVPLRLPDEVRAARRRFSSGSYALAAVMLSVLGIGSAIDTAAVRDAETARSAWTQKHLGD